MTQRTFDRPFDHELDCLDDRIEVLERILSRSFPVNPLRAGMLRELELQQQFRTMVQNLSDQSGTLGEAIELCREQLIVVERKHNELTLRGAAHDLLHADLWWETEEQVGYLCDLIHRLEAATDALLS